MKDKRSIWRLLPVVLFVTMAIALWYGLAHDPKLIPSVLIGKSAPAFELPPVEQLNIPGVALADLKKGKVSVVNIFASWCVPCREEQPLLMALSQRKDVQLVGINNKDTPADVRNFLGTYGNPFVAIGADTAGRATIDWGSYGVPETFIVDGNGIVRYKVIGGLAPSVADGSFLAEIEKAALPVKQ